MRNLLPLALCLTGLLLPPMDAADVPARPKILGVAHIAFYVSDLAKARAFWTDFLGYQECFDLKRIGTDDVQMAFIKINDTQYIELSTDKPRGAMMLSHISFYTENAEAMRDYLGARAVKVPAQVGKGRTGNKNYNITDPDGNLVEIVEYQPDSWTAREKGRFMPGTRISDHIRHVGVLAGSVEAAMNFYRGILGFEETWRGGGDAVQPLSWINLKVPDGTDYIELMLHGAVPEPEKYGTRNHVALEVADCAKAAAILKARPGSKEFRMDEMKVGVNRKRQVNIYDADGSRVELMEPGTVDGKPAPVSSALPPIR
ncbi:MAG: VOC family protein [Bryobacteraceae bacterium]|jgi:lactoylglutathione lyase